jgi:hypothetical protein
MFSRRRFLKSAGIVAGASVFDCTLLSARPGIQSAPARPWATDAGHVRVSPGPWSALPATEPGDRKSVV